MSDEANESTPEQPRKVIRQLEVIGLDNLNKVMSGAWLLGLESSAVPTELFGKWLVSLYEPLDPRKYPGMGLDTSGWITIW